jgi:hypothetical protein
VAAARSQHGEVVIPEFIAIFHCPASHLEHAPEDGSLEYTCHTHDTLLHEQ